MFLVAAGCAAPGLSAPSAAARHASADTVFLTTSSPSAVGPDLSAAVSALRDAAPRAPEESGGGAEIVSTAPRVSSESDAVGPYRQPEWTTRRRFARTRIYVLPEGQWEFEQWYRGTYDKGEAPGHKWQTEIGVGLPGRFQFDLYATGEHEDGGPTKSIGLQPELRWAPADWGVIPLNPTLYLEYKWNHHANDVAEGKILLGEELSPCTHWGMNLSVEQELGGAKTQELAMMQAVSWTVVDRKFSIGLEFEVDRVTEHGARDNPEWEYYAGPSFQWRPTDETHLDIVPLRGWHDGHDWRLFVVFGIDFGGSGPKSPMSPVSAKSR